MSSPCSTPNSGDVTPKAVGQNQLMPPFITAELFGNPRESTPPPMESPLPRTPKPQRFVNPPRTPLARFSTPYNLADDDEDIDTSRLHAGMAIVRPDSACSTYSCSSDSSVDSNTTYNSAADGSCTSFEDEDGNYDTPKGKGIEPDQIAFSAASEKQLVPEPKGKEKQRAGRARKTQWTEAMDAHLWKTYVLYQQDPKITPFFVLPGAVPPLGVCHKVARLAKRSWKDARLNGDSTPITTPKLRTKQRTIQPASETINRSDALRKISPYSWPASESATRRRLRELSRDNYGLARNQYHHKQPHSISSTDAKSRPSISPSPMKSAGTPAARDPFSTTRSMALSLTTSTASTMRPSGALASLAAGRDIYQPPTRTPQVHFGGIVERMESAVTSQETQQSILATGSLGLGVELSNAFRPARTNPHHARQLSLDSASPSLLPPLELKSSRSPYSTWPRRLKRPDQNDDEGESPTPLPPRSRARRGTLIDLFGDEPTTPVAPTPKTRTRARGYTISAGTNPLGTRRRARPSAAPLLTVTGPVSYDSPPSREADSPTARRDRFEDSPDDLPRARLGSPFAER